MKTLEELFRDKDLKNHIKINVFNTLVGSVFLYNTKIWTSNKTIDGALDSFHRRMLRKEVKLVYPRKISNIDLYKITKATPWSEIIRERRVKWLGHL